MKVAIDLEVLAGLGQDRAVALLEELKEEGLEIAVVSPLPSYELIDTLVRLNVVMLLDDAVPSPPEGFIHVGEGGIDASDPFTLADRILAEVHA